MLHLIATVLGSGVATANGANDNGKGVATLVGARILGTGRALWLAHLATFAGAIASLVVSKRLIEAFQGGGLLPADLAGTVTLMAAVSGSAALTVWLASLAGLPVSTTHALAGGLVGAGLVMAGPAAVQWGVATHKLLLPLAASPVVSALLAAILYPLLHRGRLRMGITEQTCVCVGPQRQWVPLGNMSGGVMPLPVGSAAGNLRITVADNAVCRRRYQGRVFGVSAAAVLDGLHLVSAGTLSFARGLNDTPKIAALLVGLTAALTAGPAVAIVAVAMLLGGGLAASRVAHTMSERITDMNPGSAVTANLIGSGLVVLASFLILPVSTTHVTCGAIFGIGVAQGQARWKTIGAILAAWVITLPIAAALAAAFCLILRHAAS